MKNVRKICPCETQVEEPGPHIPECPYSDQEYEPGKTPTQYVEWGEFRATREIGIWLLLSGDPVRVAIGEEIKAGAHKRKHASMGNTWCSCCKKKVPVEDTFPGRVMGLGPFCSSCRPYYASASFQSPLDCPHDGSAYPSPEAATEKTESGK